MKNYCISLFCFIAIVSTAQDNKQEPVINILKKVQSKLESLKQVSYQQTRETHYYADNYENLMKADLYFDFTANSPLNLWFQAEETKSVFIYNGNATFRLNKEEMTIDSAAAATAKAMQNNSYLYHSFAMLRNALSILITTDSFQRSMTDTVINKKTYYKIAFEGEKKYFSLLGSIDHFSLTGLQRPYYLLVDKRTMLPYQLISKYIRGNDDRDFVTVTYTNINTHPQAPTNNSWTYAAYREKYKKYQPPVKIPLVKTGTILTDFTLPAYTPDGIDSVSLKQYAGKIVLLDFWFKSCGPCMQAMPHYNELQNQYQKDGFILLTINVEDPVKDIEYFYKKYQPVYKMMFNGNKLWSSLGFTGCPSSVLIDTNGKVVQAFFGFDPELIGKKIGEIVAGKVKP